MIINTNKFLFILRFVGQPSKLCCTGTSAHGWWQSWANQQSAHPTWPPPQGPSRRWRRGRTCLWSGTNNYKLGQCSSMVALLVPAVVQILAGEKKFSSPFLSCDLMIAVYLWINSWLFKVILSWFNSSCLAFNNNE